MQLSELRNDIEVFRTFGAFTETHEAIAAFRIQHLRSSVVQTRMFLTEVSDLYNLVKSFYLMAAHQPKGLDSKQIKFLKKNGKKVSILLTSNTGFYGGVLKNLFDDFMNYISTNPGDIAIVGRVGKELYLEKGLKQNPTFFDLDDERPSDEDFNKIIGFVREYDAIVVHYVQFFSVLTQIPYYSNIAGEIDNNAEAKKDIHFAFEPSYEEILAFFETQILEAIFRQKAYEHQLARYGGKLVAMDDAVASSKVEAERLEKKGLRMKKQLLNKKQQEVFSALVGGYEEYWWEKSKLKNQSANLQL